MSGSRGSAYLVALWGLLSLSLVALLALALARASLARDARGPQAAALRAVADGLLHETVHGLLDAEARARLPADGTPVDGSFLGVATRLRVQDARGLVDANRASPALVGGLLAAAGTPEAARIRDAWLEARAREPCRTPGDLAAATGLAPADLARLAPALTFATGAQTVDPYVAPALVLEAATGAPEADIEAFLAARRGGGRPATPASFASAPLAASSGRLYRLVAEAVGENGIVARREALVEIAPRAGVAFVFRDYR